MTRQGRLSFARATRWVAKYEGKNIIAGYANWFAIDPLCALMELRMLGVTIDPERENRIKAAIEASAVARKRRQELRAQAELEVLPTNSDQNFAYIAGYTPGGVPYGTPLEELEEEPLCFDGEDEDIEQTAPAEAALARPCGSAGEERTSLNCPYHDCSNKSAAERHRPGNGRLAHWGTRRRTESRNGPPGRSGGRVRNALPDPRGP